MTGNFAFDKSSAALFIACFPPDGLSILIIAGSSISMTCVQKSLGTLICAGADPLIAFSMTRFNTSAIREGSFTSS